jgi:hypothetical protein
VTQRTAVAEIDQPTLAATWFSRLWAIAVLAHVIGNPRIGQVWPDPTALGVLSLLLGLAAVVLLIRPGDLVLGSVAGLTIVVALLEAPVIGNHWLLAALVSIALLVSMFMRDSWGWFAPTARWMLIGFYAWAAFNKLTTGFLDPDVSCAVFYGNQWLASYGLPLIPPGSTVAGGLAMLTAAIELAVPVLLLWERTRRPGVVLAMTFHFGISLDLGQHFYDFTAVLFPLFLLFLGDRPMAAMEERYPRGRRIWIPAALVLSGFVVASVAPVSEVTSALLRQGVFILWVPFGIWLIWTTIRYSYGEPDLVLRPQGAISVALIAIVVLNGVAPYLEVKTATAWNMYANNLTAAGESNHLIIRRTYPLTAGNVDPVVVVETEDPGLALYVDSGYAIPWDRFRHYLSSRPEVSVTYQRGDQTASVTGEMVGEALPWWRDRLLAFRAIDLERPVRCQAYWLPAT